METLIAGSQRADVNERRRAASIAYANSPEGKAAKIRGGIAAMKALKGASARKEWEYGGHRFRSSWEVDTARMFDLCGVIWAYEPAAYMLSSGHSYVPDFIATLPSGQSIVVEVKGLRLARGIEKVRLFKSERARLPVLIVSDDEIAAIRQSLKSAAL